MGRCVYTRCVYTRNELCARCVCVRSVWRRRGVCVCVTEGFVGVPAKDVCVPCFMSGVGCEVGGDCGRGGVGRKVTASGSRVEQSI
jgi:hypothetical protein